MVADAGTFPEPRPTRGDRPLVAVVADGAPGAELLRCLEAEGIAFTTAADPEADADVLVLDFTEGDRAAVETTAQRGGKGSTPTLA